MPRELPDWLTTYLVSTDNSEPSYLYRKWCGISVIASVLQRKCVLLGFNEGAIYPNLYVVLVGPTTARKGTALRQTKPYVNHPAVGVTFTADSTTKAALIRKFRRAEQTYTDPEGKIHIHSSLTALAEEMTVFFSQPELGFVDALTDWYDTDKDPWIHETISGDEQAIAGVMLNLLGGTVPTLLRTRLPIDAIGGGLTGRMIFVYASRRAKVVSNSLITAEELKMRKALTHDIIEIANMGGQFKLTPGFTDAYIDWYQAFDPEGECRDDKFLGYFGRKGTTIRKLAMIFSASRDSSRILLKEDFTRAFEALAEVEEVMYYALQGVGKNQYAAAMQGVMEMLLRVKETSVSILLRRFRDDVDKFTLEKILQTLETMRFCMVINGTKVKLIEENNGTGATIEHDNSLRD